MIDLGLLRKNTDYVLDLIAKKDPSYDGKRLVELDELVRSLRAQVEVLRHEKNTLAKQASGGISEEIRKKSRTLSETLQIQEKQLEDIEKQFESLYLLCPNIPGEGIPFGNKEANHVVSSWGEKPTFPFEPRNHMDLNDALQWFSLSAAARMTGSNFVFYYEQGTKLIYALTMFLLNNNMKHGFTPMLPPYLVSEQSLIGASQFPVFKGAVYEVPEDKLYLTPTSEVNLTNLYRDHTFDTQELPVRMTSWTSCFRREAGTYGAHERGLIRIHQFEKVELYTLCTPEQAVQEQERMLACAEDILKQLGLHYRVSLLAGQDCSFASAKTYDIEVWMPGQKAYYEVSSASYCTDFQARRCNIKYKTHGEKPHLVHTLNASSLALPRLMVALMETYQQEDGTIKLPDVLKSVSCGI